MYKYIKIVSFFLAMSVTIMFSACDEIEGPYKVKNSEVETNDTLFPELPDELKSIVLLEKFTGHDCPNCPYSSYILENEIDESFHEQMVTINIHTAWFGRPIAGTIYSNDYRDSIGLLIEDYFGYYVRPNPNIMVNRNPGDNGNAALWPDLIQPLFSQSPEIYLQIVNQYDSLTRKLKANIKASYLADSDKEVYLALYLIEDSVISAQKNSNPDIGLPVGDVPEYTHMHIMRGCINTPQSLWGTKLSDPGFAADSCIIKAFEYNVKEIYQAEHCSVVGFVYDNQTKLVIQAAVEGLLKE